MGLIFYGSTGVMSSHNTSRFLGPFLRWLLPGTPDAVIETVQLTIRKGGHVTEYAGLALLIWRARRKSFFGDAGPWSWTEARWAIGAATLYAVTDELHQSFVASRQGSAWDVLIDALGATVALLLWRSIWQWRRNQGQ